MKKILFLFLTFSLILFSKEKLPNQNNELAGYSEEKDEDKASKEVYIDKLQKSFFNSGRTGKENIKFIKFDKTKTYKIRTREAMTSTIVLENDEISKVIASDKDSFDFAEVEKNVISIIPKIIGVDSNLTLVGKSGTLYNFYIFSTTTNNIYNPTLITYVNNEELKNRNPEGGNSFFKLPKGRKLSDYLIIGDDTNKLYIDRKKISTATYKQIAKPTIRSRSGTIYVQDKNSYPLKALEIFNDNEFTYFRFNRELASSRFPAIFQIIDGKKAQVDFSIVGDYLIAKTLSKEWVFIEGDKEIFITRNPK